MPPKTAAIFRARTKPRLSTTTLTAQDIRALMRTDQRTAIESRNGQLVFLEQFSKLNAAYHWMPKLWPNYSSSLVPV
jgi:hypothetical protein